MQEDLQDMPNIPGDRPEILFHSFGIEILSRKQRLKFDLVTAGRTGIESLIRALVASGFRHREDIVDEICEITGDEAVGTIHSVLADGIGLFWNHDEAKDRYTPLS